jgi:hypothetical protein
MSANACTFVSRAGTATVRRLRANVTGTPSRSFASATVLMVAVLALANTSAGAPATSSCARAELPPKEKTTRTPGCACSNSWPSCVNVSVRDDAASTRSSTRSWVDPEHAGTTRDAATETTSEATERTDLTPAPGSRS